MTKYFHSHNFVFELSRQNLKLAPILKFLPNVKQSILVSTPEQLKKLLKYLGTIPSWWCPFEIMKIILHFKKNIT